MKVLIWCNFARTSCWFRELYSNSVPIPSPTDRSTWTTVLQLGRWGPACMIWTFHFDSFWVFEYRTLLPDLEPPLSNKANGFIKFWRFARTFDAATKISREIYKGLNFKSCNMFKTWHPLHAEKTVAHFADHGLMDCLNAAEGSSP